jgi:hypothetical protein
MRNSPSPRVALLASLAALCAGAARGQICDAAPSLRTVGYRAGAGAGFGHRVRALSVGGAVGLRNSPLYSTANIGLTTMEGIDRTAVTTALRAGFEAPLDPSRASGLCPFVSARTQTGPRNILDTGTDYNDVELGAGLAVGRELRRWEDGSIAIALEGLYQLVFYRYQSSTGGVTDYTGQSLVTLSLGVASGRVLFRASLSQPGDLKLAPTAFSFGIAIMGSPRHAPVPPGRAAQPPASRARPVDR